MWLFKLVLVLAAAYIAMVAMMYVAQTQMLFPTRLAAASAPLLPPTAKQLEVETPDGELLRGVRVPPVRDRAGEPLVILGFGGNAWNAGSVAAYLHRLFPHAEVVAFHYRGYRPSTGRPSAAALLADAPIVYEHILETVGRGRVVGVGLSIGAGVAAYLASRRPLDGLILVSPFDSLEALAREHFPWVPVRWLLRHQISTVDFVRGQATPTALIAAGRDTIVPPARTDAVRRAIPALVFDRTIAHADHNDLYERPDFHAAMVEALARME
jgi:pimeloyl-ACP methyl ester carboxylesterase